MSKNDDNQKIGAGHASAMFRQGLRELRGALYPESNVAQPTEYGIYGTRTPGEVAEARRSEVREQDEEPSVLAGKVQQAEARTEQVREPKTMERD
jgi:hypothetical protein